MMKYICTLCGYIYDESQGDESNGISPDTEFDDLPDDWCCPECGSPKDDFDPCEEEENDFDEEQEDYDDYGDGEAEM